MVEKKMYSAAEKLTQIAEERKIINKTILLTDDLLPRTTLFDADGYTTKSAKLVLLR